MKLVKFELQNLAYFEETIPSEAFFKLVQTVEKQVFNDGLYKNGPTVLEAKLSTFGQTEGKHLFKVYIPVNDRIEDNKTTTWLKDFTIEKAAMIRAPFNEDLGEALEKLKKFMEDNTVDLEEDKLYLVMMEVYGEYWVDLLLPFKEDN